MPAPPSRTGKRPPMLAGAREYQQPDQGAICGAIQCPIGSSPKYKDLQSFHESENCSSSYVVDRTSDFTRVLSKTGSHLCSMVMYFFVTSRWYRGKITAVEDQGFRVDFFDYGDKEVVDLDKVKPLPEEYSKLPCQAIECKLHGLKPVGDLWKDEAGNALWDMAQFLTDEKCLVAKVISEQPSSLSDSQTYTILLYDTTSHDDLSLAQELVWKGYANCDTAGDLKDLFSRPLLTRKVYPTPVHKIKDICSLIYWSQVDNPDLAVSKSAEVQCIISENVRSPRFEEVLLESRSVRDLCCLIGYLTNEQAHDHILHSVTQIILHSESICKACLAEGICMSLLRCIGQGMIPQIQQQACHALCEMIVNESFRTALAESNPISTLFDYLKTIDDEQLQCCVFQLLSALLQGSESCHSQVTREAVLKGVINSMSNSNCDKCIYQCALFCQFLSQASRKNKTLLLEHKVVVVLNSLLNQSLDSKTRGLCQALESSLTIRLPEQHVIMNQRCVDTGSTRSTPAVTWVQDTFKIVLAVKVSGAKKEDFNVKENSVHFRRTSNGINQQFDYKLFGEILPQKTGISVRPSEVLLSLRKVEKGKWSRLTKDKQKLSSLTVDFEKMATSSDSEVSEEEDPFILVKGVRAPQKVQALVYVNVTIHCLITT
ncbi:uncharacterized protein LOC121389124 [Gigantopelta aegis]|uniref:uncharacterized protein LOC121389124 n=1 Tax=Gigantopelta aegis TaxID=1735272 RepID=UPI001B88B3A8|nr:uncharacterized protein LOC121389124 [Gigantopelta aegis]